MVLQYQEGQADVPVSRTRPLPVIDPTRGDTESAEVSVPSAAWTTVVSWTPTEDEHVLGFGADVAALLATNYRYRLRVGDVVKWSEVIGSTQNSHISVRAHVGAGVTADVQVFHNEAAATNCVASIAHT